MNWHLRVSLYASLFGVLVMAVSYAPSAFPEQLGLEGWTIPHLNEQIEEYHRQSEEIDRRCAILQARMKAKRAVVRELAARRLTLLEAALRFRGLNETPPDYQGDYNRYFPGSVEEERLCRQVLVWARSELQTTAPDRVADVMARLNSEMQRYLSTGFIDPPGGEMR